MTRKHNKKKPSSKGGANGMRVLHDDMKKAYELQKTQELRFVPEQPDVPRVRFRPQQTINVELTYPVTYALSTTGPLNGALSFSLASCPNYANYTACFDQFRVVQANVKIVPAGIPTGSTATIFTVIDYDDATPLGSVSSFFGYTSLKITPAGIIDERTLSPRAAIAAYTGSAFNGYVSESPRTWIDSVSAGTQLYGLKYYVPTGSSGQSLSFYITLMIQFRFQRA